MSEQEQAISGIEVVHPLGRAWEHMKSALFPFSFSTWITLGFITFLADITFGTLRVPEMPKFSGPPKTPRFLEIARWLDSNESMIFVVAAIGFALLLVISVVFAYLSSRATFVYLNNIYFHKADFVAPWQKTRRLAHSYFAWRVILAIISALFIAGASTFFFITYRANLYDELNPQLLLKMLVPFVITAPFFLLLALAVWTLRGLVAPLMYLRNCTCGEAWPILGNLFRRQAGSFILYFLMNLCLGLLLVPIATVMALLTCCVGLLPVVNQTILQPFHYWIGGYPLFFLSQFGPEFPAPQAEEPNELESAAGLASTMPQAHPSGAIRVEACPHCGQQHSIPEGQPGTYACVKCGREFRVT